MATQYVYSFGDGIAEGDASMKQELGGKGANLAEMTAIGIPVPPGFTVSAAMCEHYHANDKTLPTELRSEIEEHLHRLEERMRLRFGDPQSPLLVSVRSGAAVSMPGMMDTVLNLGMNDRVVEGLARSTGDARMAWDSYRRFINMFGEVCMGVPHARFEDELTRIKEEAGVPEDGGLDADGWKRVVEAYKKIYEGEVGEPFPEEPREQLDRAVDAVFGSWFTPRAVHYRKIHRLHGLRGTAVNVQAMVFGNLSDTSGSGVAFTRSPVDGEPVFFGEYLPNAQGEDVVAGIRNPLPITELKKRMPDIYERLDDIRGRLEKHFRDMQDIEFTVQRGELFMLQTRAGKRTGVAAVRIATDMVDEGLITEKEALLRIEAEQLDQLLFPVFDRQGKQAALDEGRLLATGMPAGPGASSGKVVLDADRGAAWAERGEKVVLVRNETSPEDIKGMVAAQAILTATGGMTSHAAVVARGWGKCCVVGCGALHIDMEARRIRVGDREIAEGDEISVDGVTGEVILGAVSTTQSSVVRGLVEGDECAAGDRVCRMFTRVMGWCDIYRRIGLRANADSARDAGAARNLGAEGIGLCRTEHMFFEGDRIWAMRAMILADDEAGRVEALEKLLPYQRSDFEGLFEAMNKLPVTIRLLDPPLHEFLPEDEEDNRESARRLDIEPARLRAKVRALREQNPMLGHRGCRLSISYPEICRMQVRAIMEAAASRTKAGGEVHPEIMIPLIGTSREFEVLEKLVRETADSVLREQDVEVAYQVGTMMEIPRAVLVAGDIAKRAEFFSFGTNDLTQMTFGYSRDDVGAFLPVYLENKILDGDPFISLDRNGVGELIRIGLERGRAARPDLVCGVCGEHGGDPESVHFLADEGVDYVSTSPYRVPVARLAAAQAEIAREKRVRSAEPAPAVVPG